MKKEVSLRKYYEVMSLNIGILEDAWRSLILILTWVLTNVKMRVLSYIKIDCII